MRVRGRCLWFVVSVALTLQSSTASPTFGGDVASLRTVKTAYEQEAMGSSASFLFQTWREGTDPCIDQWNGVACVIVSPDADVQRVSDLVLRAEGETFLSGALVADIGLLDALQRLDLSGNQLTGTFPEEIAQLPSLEHLNVSGNRLAGALPSFQPNASLEAADLSFNDFSGQLPEAWCGGNFSVRLAGNPRLCGAAPECGGAEGFPDLLGGLAGTSLAAPGELMNWTCDASPPVCGDYCGVSIGPYFVHSADGINYTFQGFEDAESGIGRYEVALSRVPESPDGYVEDGIVMGWGPARCSVAEEDSAVGFCAGRIDLNGSAPLEQGRRYVVGVRAWNRATPPVNTTEWSNPGLVSLGSVTAGVVFAGEGCQAREKTTLRDFVWACWSGFADPIVGLEGFYAQIFDKNSMEASRPRWFATEVQGIPVRLYPSAMERLQVGSSYIVRVWALNKAGVASDVSKSLEIEVVPSEIDFGADNGRSSNNDALVTAVACFGALLFLGLVLVIFFILRRYARHDKVHRKYLEHQSMVNSLIMSLEEVNSDEGLSSSTIRRCKELAFVTTDLMDSTKMAAASVEGFQQVQDIHDSVMREGISRHSGYEINTEGDAFQVAFKDVFDAIKFCMHVQYRLLEVPWSRAVLKLPSCKEVYSTDGDLLFKGPRVRMGIHWARKGTFSQRLHPLTKHRIFAGPSWRIAQELGDGANGGQVLMTHDVWVVVRNNMGKASYPVVQQIGLYKFEASSMPMWVYEVKELLSMPLRRNFPEPRGIQLVDNGWALNIMTPPVKPEDKQSLAVVALALKPPPKYAYHDLPPSMSQRLYEQLAIQVMQFRGYIFRVNKKRGYFLVAFGGTMDSLRFCHSFQLLLMFIGWPPEAESFCEKQVLGPDGRYIFNGPRIAMAINEESDYEATTLYNQHPHREDAVDYNGPCVDHAKELSGIVHGGQVVLTQHAWINVQDQLPAQAQALSLGVHRVSNRMSEPMLLMQVMPGVLNRRQFPKLPSLEELEPGYLSSPDPSKDIAIVFVKVSKPAVVTSNERIVLHKKADMQLGKRDTPEGDADYAMFLDENEDLMKADNSSTSSNNMASPFLELATTPSSGNFTLLRAYAKSIKLYETALRDALKRFEGYECKEPEPGKFTLAFACLEQAIMWGTTLQEELLHVKWPEELLAIEECKEVWSDDPELLEDEAGTSDGQDAIPQSREAIAISAPGQPPAGNGPSNSRLASTTPQRMLVYRGLRAQMGLAYGRVASRKPLNTGRADYFGNLPNTAARVMSLAKPGQFLVEGSATIPTQPFTDLGGEVFNMTEGRAYEISLPESAGAVNNSSGVPEIPRNQSASTGAAPTRVVSVVEASKTLVSNLYSCPTSGQLRRKAIISHYGYFLLKGLDEPKLMLQVASPALTRRKFSAKNAQQPVPAQTSGHFSRYFRADLGRLGSVQGASAESLGSMFGGLVRRRTTIQGGSSVKAAQMANDSVDSQAPSNTFRGRRMSMDIKFMFGDNNKKSPGSSRRSSIVSKSSENLQALKEKYESENGPPKASEGSLSTSEKDLRQSRARHRSFDDSIDTITVASDQTKIGPRTSSITWGPSEVREISKRLEMDDGEE